MHTLDISLLVAGIVTFFIAMNQSMRFSDSANQLSRMIAKYFPSYYSTIVRQPSGSAHALSAIRKRIFLLRLLLKGIPTDFPANKALRRLAEKTFREGVKTYAMIAITALLLLVGAWVESAAN